MGAGVPGQLPQGPAENAPACSAASWNAERFEPFAPCLRTDIPAITGSSAATTSRRLCSDHPQPWPWPTCYRLCRLQAEADCDPARPPEADRCQTWGSSDSDLASCKPCRDLGPGQPEPTQPHQHAAAQAPTARAKTCTASTQQVSPVPAAVKVRNFM